MTLRDALAAALTSFDWAEVTVTREVSTPADAPNRVFESSVDADAFAARILSDPAFREALVEAVQSGLSAPVYVAGYSSPVFVGTVVSWIPAITGRENVARTIVARMLDAAE